jgi:hypothetical protein
MQSDSPLPKTKGHPEGQLERANKQLRNFTSLLRTHGEGGLPLMARDMAVMARQIFRGEPIDTY